MRSELETWLEEATRGVPGGAGIMVVSIGCRHSSFLEGGT